MCVCLVTPELSLLGRDGEGQEEKEKKSANMQQLFVFGGPRKHIMRTAPLPATMEQKGKQKGNK